MTFFSIAIPVLNISLLPLFAMLLLMLLCYFLVLVETNFSISRGEKVDLISLLFYCYLSILVLFAALILLENFSFLTATASTLLVLFSIAYYFLGCVENWQTFRLALPAPHNQLTLKKKDWVQNWIWVTTKTPVQNYKLKVQVFLF